MARVSPGCTRGRERTRRSDQALARATHARRTRRRAPGALQWSQTWIRQRERGPPACLGPAQRVALAGRFGWAVGRRHRRHAGAGHVDAPAQEQHHTASNDVSMVWWPKERLGALTAALQPSLTSGAVRQSAAVFSCFLRHLCTKWPESTRFVLVEGANRRRRGLAGWMRTVRLAEARGGEGHTRQLPARERRHEHPRPRPPLLPCVPRTCAYPRVSVACVCGVADALLGVCAARGERRQRPLGGRPRRDNRADSGSKRTKGHNDNTTTTTTQTIGK